MTTSQFLWLAAIGFLSAFAVGPAMFNIIRNYINEGKVPKRALIGFLVGDLTYVLLSVLLLRTPLLKNIWIQNTLTGTTAAILFLYAVYILKNPTIIEDIKIPKRNGFRTSYLLTISNLHLLLIYSGLFINFAGASSTDVSNGLSLYIVSLLLGVVAFFTILKSMRDRIKEAFRKIEVATAFGFFGFSFYYLFTISFLRGII